MKIKKDKIKKFFQMIWLGFLIAIFLSLYLIANKNTRHILCSGMILIYCIGISCAIIEPIKKFFKLKLSGNAEKIQLKFNKKIITAVAIGLVFFIFFMNYLTRILLLSFILGYIFFQVLFILISFGLQKLTFKKMI